MKRARMILFFLVVLMLSVLCGPVLAMDMVSYWRFDEDSGLTAYDSFSDNDGIIDGAQWTNGIVRSALSFDGVDDYVEVPDDVSLDLIVFTTEAWFKLETLPGNGKWLNILMKGEDSITDNHSYAMSLAGSGLYGDAPLKIIAGFENDVDTNYRLVYDLDGSYVGEFVHAACTLDGDDWNLYVDGTKVNGDMYRANTPISSLSNTVPATVDSPLYIGANYEAGGHSGMSPGMVNFFPGIIDDVAIYGRALSSEEIEQHYKNGLDGIGYLAIEVDIDIKPGSDPNPINQGSSGLVPVAILSSEEFNATHVDPTTILLAGANVVVRGKGKSLAHKEDVNTDGRTDLVVQVETESFGDLGDGGTVKLTGTTFDGQDIVGYDEVVIVPSEQ